MTKEARARVITVGLKNPTSDVSKEITEARAEGKGADPIYYIFRLLLTILLLLHYIFIIYLTL